MNSLSHSPNPRPEEPLPVYRLDPSKWNGTAPLVELLDRLIFEALEKGVQRIDMSRWGGEGFVIRHDHLETDEQAPPLRLAGPLVARAKIIGGVEIGLRNEPQFGSVELHAPGRAPCRMNITVRPTDMGEELLIELLQLSPPPED